MVIKSNFFHYAMIYLTVSDSNEELKSEANFDPGTPTTLRELNALIERLKTIASRLENTKDDSTNSMTLSKYQVPEIHKE